MHQAGMLEKTLAFTVHSAVQTVASATDATHGDFEPSKCSDKNRPGVIDTENMVGNELYAFDVAVEHERYSRCCSSTF